MSVERVLRASSNTEEVRACIWVDVCVEMCVDMRADMHVDMYVDHG